MSQISRPKAAAARIGVGLTKFAEDFVDNGGDRFVPDTNDTVARLRPTSLGRRAIGFFDDEIDKLIEGLRKLRDKAPRVPREPAVPAEYHPSRHRRIEKAQL
jgi:hypothetical protein